MTEDASSERAAVVAWLREQAELCAEDAPDGDPLLTAAAMLHAAASDIERGDHLTSRNHS